jgi:NodT family efflux transporter outer membrane factor (OMF) lipoprotein
VISASPQGSRSMVAEATRSRLVAGFALGLILLSLAGCTVGPKYVRPPAEVPPAYKESGNWKQAHPADALSKGNWWEVYQQQDLNALEAQINVSNQTLKASEDQFLHARAAVGVSRSALFPTISAGLSATPTQLSANRPLTQTGENGYYTDYVLSVDASYEADVWGRVRRTVEASRSEAQASAADLANVSLSLHAELALDYFRLRGLDAQEQLLNATVAAYEKALNLTQSRFHAGIASALDVAQAQAQLENTRAQAQDVEVQRSQYEHAIAVLIGKPPADFTFIESPLMSPPPVIPPGLPSDLLERRPDISAAERRMQEANANVGVARAAYFPLIMFSPAGGLESTAISTLIQGPSIFWSLGAAATGTLLDFGHRRGLSQEARADYDQSVANYRQSVLGAFQDVEDNLAALRILEQEAATEDAAVAAAQHSLSLSTTLYRGGLANYLLVTTAQSTALRDQVTAVEILTRRLEASVLLVKALGGGWTTSQIPHV